MENPDLTSPDSPLVNPSKQTIYIAGDNPLSPKL